MPRYSVNPSLQGSGSEPYVVGATARTRDAALLGRLHEQGPLRRVLLDITAENVVAIFGKRGSGKSYTLGALAECIAAPIGESAIGMSSGRKGGLLFDTLNVFWSLANPIISDSDRLRFDKEAADLDSWGLRCPPLNVTVWIPAGQRETHTPESYRELRIAPSDFTPDDLVDLLELDSQSDLMGQLVVEAAERARQKRVDFSFAELLEVLETEQELSEYYAVGTLRGARQRVRAVSRQPLFMERVGTPIASLLVPGHLSVLEMGSMSNSARSVVASVLLRRIHHERARSSDAEKQLALNTRLGPEEVDRLRRFVAGAVPPSWVLIDEAQNILPSDRQVKSSDAVLRFVREGRNFGLSLALTTQQPAAVDQRILAQADTVICHRLTVAQDISRMRDNLKCAEPSEVRSAGIELSMPEWLRGLEAGTAVVTNTECSRTFALQVRPRITPHGGTGFQAP